MSPDWKLKDETQRLLLDSRRVVPFVGAGLGVPVHLPSGPGLAKRLREEHPLAAGRQFSAPDNLIQVADELTSGGPQDRQAVAEFIIELLDLERDPQPIPVTFRHLARIPSNLYVTTSYDRLAERAADAQGIQHETFTWQNLPAPEDMHPGAQHPLYIVHLHGSAEDPDSLILDSQSYHNLATNSDVEQFLYALFTFFNVCFFGTALDEQYLAGWLLAWRRTRPHHVLVNDEEGIEASTQGRSPITPAMHGVVPESFPSGRFDLLEGFCEDLVSRPASTMAPLLTSEAPSAASPTVADATLPGLPPAAARYVNAEWGPDWARRALRDLGENNPDELERLQGALGTDDDPSIVERLIREPEPWMREGSFRLWVAAARFAELQGDWALSRDAWQQASQRVEADEVGCLVSASVAADVAGDQAASRDLLKKARALDPTHPRVRLQDVGEETDPDKQLEELRRLWDEPGDIGAMAHAQTALNFLLRNDVDEAEQHLEAARRVRPDLMQARIVDAHIRVHGNRIALESGAHLDGRTLASVKEDCLNLREELVAMRRWSESVRLLMLAADATAMQWEFEEAGKLLLTASEEEKNAESGRIVLADAALRAQQFAVALELLQGVPKKDVAVMRATAHLAVGNEPTKQRALKTLDEIIGSRDDEFLRAAVIRATRAPQFFEAAWPHEAERVLIENGFEEAAFVSKAMWLHATGQKEQAVELLQQQDPNVRVVEALMALAIMDDDEQEAARVAGYLLALGPDNRSRLACAEALFKVGDVPRAKAEATTVVNDAGAAPQELGRAYYLLGGIAADVRHGYEEALTAFEHWARVEPSNERHVWARVFALTRLARQSDALKLLEDTHAFPVTMDDARLAASVYARMEDPIEALRRVQQVIDRAPEPDEELNRQLKLLALHRAGAAELPEDLAARVRPESVEELNLRAVSLEQLQELAKKRQATQEELLEEIMEGEVPTTSLAAIIQSDIGAVWMRLAARPYGFGFSELDVLEQRLAEAALDRGCVADPTALFTLGDLGGEAGPAALDVLTSNGRVAQATLDDLDAGVTALLPELPAMQRQELLFDPQSGAPIPIDWPRELVEADHNRARKMLELAQRLRVEPDIDPGRGTRFDSLFEQSAPTALRSLIGSAAVAQRTGLPVLSDDRCLRLLLRGVGIPAFGTVALLEVLVAREELTEDALQAARTRLRVSGYMGVTPTNAELAALVEASDGDASQALQAVFRDPAPWRTEYGTQVLRVVNFLNYVFRVYPDQFPDWVTRLLATMEDIVHLSRVPEGLPPTLRERLQWHAEWLLVATWMGVQQGGPATQDFLRAMRKQLNSAASELGAFIDPLPGASVRFGGVIQAAGGIKGGIPVGLLAQMPIADVMKLLGVDPRSRSSNVLLHRGGGARRTSAEELIAMHNQRAATKPWRGRRGR